MEFLNLKTKHWKKEYIFLYPIIKRIEDLLFEILMRIGSNNIEDDKNEN